MEIMTVNKIKESENSNDKMMRSKEKKQTAAQTRGWCTSSVSVDDLAKKRTRKTKNGKAQTGIELMSLEQLKQSYSQQGKSILR